MINLDNLFKRISDLNLNAKKISEMTGISSGNISDWKNGRSFPSASKLNILANCLNCSVDYLLGRTNDPQISGQPSNPLTMEEAKEDTAFYNELKHCSDMFDISEDEALDRINQVNNYFSSAHRSYKEMLDLIIKLDNTDKFETEIKINKTKNGIVNYMSLNFPIITGECPTESGTDIADKTNEYNRNLAAYLDWYLSEKSKLKDCDYKSNLIQKLIFYNFYNKIDKD